MAEAIRQKAFSRVFPINRILTERFDSLAKVSALQVPVLFLHGGADSVIPPDMSQQLYAAAPEPKQLLIIPDAEHVSIYRQGNKSYLRAIQRFVQTLPSQ